jgi:iron-sulfur cluster insertion protein
MSQDFSMTESAMKRISFLIAKRDDSSVKLRVSIESGGCSGFQYHYEFVNDEVTKDDLYIEKNGAKLIIDSTSLDIVRGSILDYNEDLNGAYFQIKNPLAASGCGCGNSFNI